MSKTYYKDPDAKLDYKIDWSDWLDGDTISTSTWIVPSGITEESSTNTNTTTTIWLSGGTHAVKYKVVNRITTAAGRIEDRSFHVKIQEN